MKRGLAGLIAGTLFGAIAAGGATLAFAQTSADPINACVDVNGGVRIADDCRPNESRLSWNVEGPPGLAGQDGEDGEDGIDGQDGNLALAGQSCTEGQFVTGFDANGDITCGAPASGPTGPLDCDDGDASTIDTVENGVCVHTPEMDADGDGFAPSDGDCNDNQASVNPDATEEYNSIDDNCDGRVDEYYAPYGSNEGVCSTGIQHTVTGEIVVEAYGPFSEVAGNGVDDDCDGMTDEGWIPGE